MAYLSIPTSPRQHSLLILLRYVTTPIKFKELLRYGFDVVQPERLSWIFGEILAVYGKATCLRCLSKLWPVR